MVFGVLELETPKCDGSATLYKTATALNQAGACIVHLKKSELISASPASTYGTSGHAAPLELVLDPQAFSHAPIPLDVSVMNSLLSLYIIKLTCTGIPMFDLM